MKKIRLSVCLSVCLHLRSKEHRFKKSLIVTNDGWNLVGPEVIEVRESEYESFLGSKVKKTLVLETRNSDQ